MSDLVKREEDQQARERERFAPADESKIKLPTKGATVWFQRHDRQTEATVMGVWESVPGGMISLSVENEGEYRNVRYSPTPKNNAWGYLGEGNDTPGSVKWGGAVVAPSSKSAKAADEPPKK